MQQKQHSSITLTQTQHLNNKKSNITKSNKIFKANENVSETN